MKIIVTGSSGFLAKNLIDLLAKKDYKILGADKNFLNKQKKLKNFKFIKSDFNNFNDLKKKFSKEKNIEALIHCGALQPKNEDIDTYKFFDTNVKSSLNLINLAKLLNIKNIIYCSSFSVYGSKCTIPINEKENTDPENFYGLTKLLSEKIFKFFSFKEKINIIILRFDGIYGVNQNLPGMVDDFTKKMLKNKKIEIFNNGSLRRNQVYVKDAAKSILLSLKKISKTKFKIINIGGKNPITTKKLVNILKKKTKTNSEIIFLKKKLIFLKDKFLDISLAKKFLYYKPTDIKKNINDYLKSYVL
tara:strand:+ start:36360 stop:37268 length:909 start_codon:yes stop_codon:yes gene_type:complete